MKYLEKQSPARIIAIGFLAVFFADAAGVCEAGSQASLCGRAVYIHQRCVCYRPHCRGHGRYLYGPGTDRGGPSDSDWRTGCTIKGAACNEEPHAFHYRIPQEAFYKAAIVTALSALVVCLGTFFMCILEPAVPFEDILFEITSAFGIVGLSTGITPGLSSLSKLLEVLVMYIGRLGPLTIVTIWVFKPTKSVSYAEGSISIG